MMTNKNGFTFVEQPKQVIKGNLLKRIQEIVENNRDIVYYILMCPSYPNDGNRFTYSDQKISSELPFNYCHFQLVVDRNLQHIYSLFQGNMPNVIIKPLVCEIEQDIGFLTSKFALGQQDFIQKVNDTAKTVESEMRERYCGYGVNINGGTFSLINGLPEIQSEMEAKIKTGNVPIEFLEQRNAIASIRKEMFENLYGANTDEEKIEIATRQMKNYLAVTKGLAKNDPGCFVINGKTPNSFYLEHDYLPSVIGISDHEKPLFQFLK